MSLYALDNLDDAYAATRSFLTPIDRSTWVKLAVVIFFIGGAGTNFNPVQYNTGGGGGTGAPPMDFGPRVWLLIAGIFAVILVLALVFALIGSIMEFVFVESLRRERVAIRDYWSRYWRSGLRLFGFRLLIGLFVIGIGALLALPFILAAVDIGPAAPVWIPIVLVLVPLFLLVAVVVGLVNAFTTVFVVPIMMLDDCGVVAGWRRLWPTITAQWQQYLAYAVVGFVLSLVAGVVVGILILLLVVLLLIPFGLLFALGLGVFFLLSEAVGIAVLVLVGLAFGFVVLVAALLVQVPVQTYLRYYALLVLGDVESDFDIIPTQRAAVRESSEPE